MKKVLSIFLSLFVLLLLVNRFSIYLIENHTSYELIHNLPISWRSLIYPWLNFDGKNYLTIATSGYPQGDVLSVFFPVYPLLIRIFSLNSVVNSLIVGLLVSFVASFFAVVFFYKLVKNDFNEKIALKSTLLLLIFPSAFYLFAYYTEGLFLLLSILVFWFLSKKNLLFAAVFTSLATATRITGLALIPVLIYEGFYLYKKEKKIPWALVLSPLGLIFYSIFTYLKFGNPFLMISGQSDPRFGRPITVFSPFLVLKDAMVKIVEGPLPSYDNPFVYPVIILEFLFAIFALITLFFAVKNLPKRYSIYMFFSIALIFFGGALSSVIRYLLLVFPIFIFLASSFAKKILYLYYLISFSLLLFASSLFLRNYWIS